MALLNPIFFFLSFFSLRFSYHGHHVQRSSFEDRFSPVKRVTSQGPWKGSRRFIHIKRSGSFVNQNGKRKSSCHSYTLSMTDIIKNGGCQILCFWKWGSRIKKENPVVCHQPITYIWFMGTWESMFWGQVNRSFLFRYHDNLRHQSSVKDQVSSWG